MSVATAVSGDDGRLVHVTPGFCALFGYDTQELLGISPGEVLVHPDDRAEMMIALQQLTLGTAAEVRRELRLIAKDGRVFPGELTASEMSDPRTGGKLRIVNIQDLSGRKQLEVAYVEERHLFDEFLANVPFQVYFKDRDSRFLRVSQMQAARLGFQDASELIGKTDADIFDAEHALRARDDEERVMRTGQPIIGLEEREVYLGTQSGDEREPGWVLTSKLPLLDSAGETIGTFGVSQDITLRKRAEASLRESEERWRALLAHLQEIVVLADADGRMIYATSSIQRWLGYHPEELVGVELATTGHPDDGSMVGDAIAHLSTEGSAQVTHRVRHKDGSWHTLESSIVSLEENPAVGAVLFASTDITERIAHELERERMDLELRVSHRLEAVGQLAAGIAHEINTPLQYVGDSVVFLHEAVDDLLVLAGRYRELLWLDEPLKLSERREIMTEAEEHADLDYLLERIPAAFERTADGVARVRSIVQAMKRFSHPSSGEVVPEDLGEAIETTLAVCRNEYKYVAEVELALGEVPPVPCNLAEINQVFLNLIVNAAQAIGEAREQADGGSAQAPLGLIKISSCVQGNEAVIEIADDGPGIPKELQERIYEPFFTTKQVGKGTGQGLALARSTLDRHNGSLECESVPGSGTTFRIRLPLDPPGGEKTVPGTDIGAAT